MEAGLTRRRLCGVDDLRTGEIRAFQVDRISVVLARSGEDSFHALRNSCPHQGAELSRGSLTGTNLPSAYGEFCYGRDLEILRCPNHKWEYDVLTGRSLHSDGKYRVKTYPVTIEDGQVYIEYRP